MDEARKKEKRVWAGISNAYRSVALHSCVYPNCSTGDPIIRAHSIQRARVLEKIAVDGHVYTFKSQPEGISLCRIGIRKATTFTGFCKKHDNNLFASIDFGDNLGFEPTDTSQIVALSLRSIACEYWKKLNVRKFHRKMLRLANENNVKKVAEWCNIEMEDAMFFVQHASHFNSPSLHGTEDAVKRMRRQIDSLLYQLKTQKYHLSKTACFIVEGPPTIAASTQFPLDYDLMGQKFNSNRRTPDLPEVALNILPEDDRTYFAFLWHRRFNNRFRPFFTYLKQLDPGKRQVRFSQMLVMHCENVAISPALVDSWTDRQTAAVKNLFNDTLYSAKPYGDAPNIDLFGDWTI